LSDEYKHKYNELTKQRATEGLVQQAYSQDGWQEAVEWKKVRIFGSPSLNRGSSVKFSHLANMPERYTPCRKRSAIWKRKDRALRTTIAKFEKMNDKNKKQVVIMAQRYFIDSWLLPCLLRSHRIANPRPKMGFDIFRLYPPATRQAAGTIKFCS